MARLHRAHRPALIVLLLHVVACRDDPRPPAPPPPRRPALSATGAPLAPLVRLPAADQPSPQAQFSPDGRRLLTCCLRRDVDGAPTWSALVWDLTSATLVADLPHDDHISRRGTPPQVAWSPGGQLAITVQPNDVALWSTSGPSPGTSPVWSGPASYGYLAVSADATRLLTGTTDESVHLLDLTTKQILHQTPPVPATGLRVDLAWAPDDTVALVDGALWSRNGKDLGTPPLGGRWPNDAPLDHRWHHDTLFVAAHDAITAIDPTTATVRWTHPHARPPIDPHPTAPLLAHLTESGEVALLDTTTRIVSTRFTGPRFERRDDTRDDSLAMRFSPTGAHLVVQRALDPIAVCDVAKKQCHPLAMVATENAPAPQWRGDVVFLQGAGVLAWSPDSSKRWHVEAKPDHLGFDVTPDGRHAAFALGSEVRLVRLRDRRAVRLTARPGPKNVVGEMEPAGLDLLAP